ncbi:MAG TPA: zf-HC2 domain-containing protein [Thermoanaerobaculia bacterium]|jgi:hypothetical protein
MDHTAATRDDVPERYLLGELSAEDAEAYEAHAFECEECAAVLRAGARLMDGGRRVAAERRNVVSIDAPRRRTMRWMWLAPVAAALAVAVLLIPRGASRLTTAEFGRASDTLLTGEMRGPEDAPVVHVSDDAATELQFDIPADPQYVRYDAALHGPRGDVVGQRTITPQEAQSSIPLLLRALPAGSYVLTVAGVRKDGNRTALVSRRFNVVPLQRDAATGT